MAHEELIKEIKGLPLNAREALLEATLSTMLARIHNHVFSLTKNETDTEEIVQETVLYVLRLVRSIEEKGLPKPNIEHYLLHFASDLAFRKMDERMAGLWNRKPDMQSSEEDSQNQMVGQQSLSQRLYGVLKFDGDPPNDEEVKDMITDYLIRKYS